MATRPVTTGAPTRAPAFAPLPSRIMSHRRREAIEGEIEMHLARVDLLIRRLDRQDAPSDDLEDDDPAGDPLDLNGEAPTDDGRELLATLPLYAIDQSRGPTNEATACRHHQAREMGMVHTGTGRRLPH